MHNFTNVGFRSNERETREIGARRCRHAGARLNPRAPPPKWPSRPPSRSLAERAFWAKNKSDVGYFSNSYKLKPKTRVLPIQFLAINQRDQKNENMRDRPAIEIETQREEQLVRMVEIDCMLDTLLRNAESGKYRLRYWRVLTRQVLI